MFSVGFRWCRPGHMRHCRVPVLAFVRTPPFCETSGYRSHFGSRYKSGRCARAALFVFSAWVRFPQLRKQKCQRHPKDFPGGPPPQYYPGLAAFDFRVRMGSGIFIAVWPLATTIHPRKACFPLNTGHRPPKKTRKPQTRNAKQKTKRLFF